MSAVATAPVAPVRASSRRVRPTEVPVPAAHVEFVFTRRGGLTCAIPVTVLLFVMPLVLSLFRPESRYLSGSSWGDGTLGALLFLAVFGIVWATVDSHRRMRVVSGAEAALVGWSGRRR